MVLKAVFQTDGFTGINCMCWDERSLESETFRGNRTVRDWHLGELGGFVPCRRNALLVPANRLTTPLIVAAACTLNTQGHPNNASKALRTAGLLKLWAFDAEGEVANLLVVSPAWMHPKGFLKSFFWWDPQHLRYSLTYSLG